MSDDDFEIPAPRRTTPEPEPAPAPVAKRKATPAATPAKPVAAIVARVTRMPSADLAASGRLSVEIPLAALRRLRMRAMGQDKTVREYVIELLERDGIVDEITA